MNLMLRALTPAQLKDIEVSQSTEAFTAMVHESEESKRRSVEHLIRLQAPAVVIDAMRRQGIGEPNWMVPRLALGQVWHGLHALLTGKSWGGRPPAAWVVLGGKNLGDEVGYGPTRVLTVGQTKRVAGYLKRLNLTRLEQTYRALDFLALDAHLYLGEYWNRHDEGWPWLKRSIDELRQYYGAAGHAGNGMLIWMT